MADIESLSFALLIPFSICFVLVFLVCCFADKVKNMCRFPSAIPSSYVNVTSHRHSRHNRPRGRLRSARQPVDREETRILITDQEERSRNSSESSTETGPSVLSVIPEQGSLLVHQGQIVCPQTVLGNGQIISYPAHMIPHAVLLTPTTNFASPAHLSMLSLQNNNNQSRFSETRQTCSLPSITEKVEVKISSHVQHDVLSNLRDSDRRPIRNLPQVISLDIIPEKK